MLAEVERRREALRQDKGAALGDETVLHRQLDSLKQALCAGLLPKAEWEQHEMHWLAHGAELRRSVVRRSAHFMLAFEDIDRREPNRFIDNAAVLELLHWWREEGGREDYLGQITLEERRELEDMASRWREQRP